MRSILQPLSVGLVALLAGLWIADRGERRNEVELQAETTPRIPVTPPTLSSPAHRWIESLAGSLPSDLPAFYQLASDDPERQNLVAHYWARSDPAGFLQHLLADDPPFFSNPDHANHLFTEWARRDFLAALAAAKTIPTFTPQREWLLGAVIRAGMDSDPATATPTLTSIKCLSGSSAWIAPDPEAAKAAIPLLAKLPQLGTLETTLGQNLKKWIEIDPQEALDWVREYTRGRPANFFSPVYRAFEELAEREPRMAMEAIETLEPQVMRANIGRNIAEDLAGEFPSETAAWIEQNLDGWYLAETAGHTAEELSEGDPVSGVEFALLFKDVDARDRAIERSVAVYHSRDREGLAAWVAAIEDGPTREAVAQVIVELEQ